MRKCWDETDAGNNKGTDRRGDHYHDHATLIVGCVTGKGAGM
jgi:hypothetical protein